MNTYTVAAAAIIISLLLLLLRRSGNGKKKLNLPPSPIGLPIIGHLHLIISPNTLDTVSSLVAKYGDVVYLRLGKRNYILVSSPSAVEECLSGPNDITFCNRMSNSIIDKHIFYGNTTLSTAPYGPLWRDLRRLGSVELFSGVSTTRLAPVREEELRMKVKALCEPFVGGDGGMVKVNVRVLLKEIIMNTFTQTVIGKRYFGKAKDVSEERSRQIVELVDKTVHLAGLVSVEDYFPAVQWFGVTKLESAYRRLGHGFDTVLQALIDERREFRRNSLSHGKEKNTLLDVLLSLQEKDPVYHTDMMIKGIMMSFMIIANEGPNTSIEWCLSLLLNHPDILEQLRRDIDTQVGHSRLITDADLPHIPLLHRVLKETMRIYPFGPLLTAHEASADCKVAGYDIPAGTLCLPNAFHIQRDPSIWDEPMKFKPERFEGEEEDPKARFKNFPFGTGRRMCPAESLSYRLMMLILGGLLQCFDWGTVGGEMVDMTETNEMSLYKLNALEAMYKPREVMMDTLMKL